MYGNWRRSRCVYRTLIDSITAPSGPVLKDSPIMLRISLLLFVLLVSAASSAQAQVTIPNTFSDGTPALASEVN